VTYELCHSDENLRRELAPQVLGAVMTILREKLVERDTLQAIPA
jgi:hypothetical protein